MAKTDNYSQYVCDRCGETAYAQPNSPDAQKWSTIRRITAAGSETSRVLCQACAREYQEFVEGQERDFINFMKGGK